ncbi:hypothetical protein GCM10023144_21740 [Pigmentiphaga soli]|uniref:Uncharacterized protein n=1 Tax=Pigmentiphaga soli TaxID=1007095 RepID=A0ABP8GZD8_9BURK
MSSLYPLHSYDCEPPCEHLPLRTLRERAEQWPSSRVSVQAFDVDGWRYVMKRSRPPRWAGLRAWAGALSCLAVFGVWPAPGRLRVGDIHHEAARLRALREQGQAVPRVYLETGNHLVFEYCGLTVERILEHMRPAARLALLSRVVDDLADFHRAGHWHGGAQLRNLTMMHGRIYRIDFEENVGAALPLPIAQAYDVLLTFHSMVDHLGGDPAAGTRLLARYLARVQSPGVAGALGAADRWLGRLRRIEPWLGARLRRGHDVRRALALAGIVHGGLAA